MSNLVEYYRILGVSAGAGIVDITSSYRRLCRMYHPDVNSDPDSEELMKRINIAYSALREKLGREAAFRDRAAYTRPARRYAAPDMRQQAAGVKEAASALAFSVLNGYFKAINDCDYKNAYSCLSDFDKRHITFESFDKWRRAVARLFPMRGYKLMENPVVSTVTFKDGKTFRAWKYRVEVAEEDLAEEKTQAGEVEKLVIEEGGAWRVFLGYKDVTELTRNFDERLEAKQKRDLAKKWEEYYSGLCPEYNMLGIKGMRKAAARELYRLERYGGALTFAAISVTQSGGANDGVLEELLRSAAKTISKSIRITDIPAYAGDGVFAVMFVELRKKSAADIVESLAERIKKEARERVGRLPVVECAFEAFTGAVSQDALDNVLKKYNKKL